VLHIFDDVCNLIDVDDDVLSLVTAEIGDGPFSVVLPQVQLPTLISPSSPVTYSEDLLAVGDLCVEVSNARVWNPLPDWDRLRSGGVRLAAGQPELITSIKKAAPPESLAALIVHLPASKSAVAANVLRQAREPAGKLIDGLRKGDVERICSGVAELAGLGEGLTPAGDDWIMGCLLGARIILDENEMLNVASAVEEVIAARTTPLSAASIRAAARGECGAVWHDLLEAMQGADILGIRSSAERIMSCGHTSGADALAGFAAVLGEDVPGFFFSSP
jgi:hypothetical protein